MDFEEYQKKAGRTALYPDVGNNFIYPTLGLAGEAGEVANKVQKIIRDNNSVFNDEHRAKVKDELGDVLWYLSQTATEFKLSLEEVAAANIEKLASRLDRNKISGSGDTR